MPLKHIRVVLLLTTSIRPKMIPIIVTKPSSDEMIKRPKHSIFTLAFRIGIAHRKFMEGFYETTPRLISINIFQVKTILTLRFPCYCNDSHISHKKMTKRFGGFCNGDKNMWNGIPFRKRLERIVAVRVIGETTQLFTCPGLSFVLIRGHFQSGEKVFYIHIFIFRKYMNSSVWRYQGGSIACITCLYTPLLVFSTNDRNEKKSSVDFSL